MPLMNNKGLLLVRFGMGLTSNLHLGRTVSEQVLNLWWELVELINAINLSDEEDKIFWMYNPSGRYNVQSLYVVVNFRGITPIFISSIWKLHIPPRVQFFLWLLSKNKVLIEIIWPNKRREVSDPTCLMCAEKESINHLF